MRGDFVCLIVTLLAKILQTVAVIQTFDPGLLLDLIPHVQWNHSNPAIQEIPGVNGHSTAYSLQGSRRRTRVSGAVLQRIGHLLKHHEEFTLLATIKQIPDNTGSILSFSSEAHRYLEVESSGRRNELRLHYRHKEKSYTEIFPNKLADNQWHTIALSMRKDYVQLFIDCQKIYERQTREIDWDFSRHRGVHLWLGQRNSKQAYLKGAIEKVKFVFSPQGYLEQCPYADVACPSCSQYKRLENSVKELYSIIQELSHKLSAAEDRISELEGCECMRSCDVDGKWYKDGHSWSQEQCTTCTCRDGTVVCEKPSCPELKCAHPVQIEGHCCPTCLKHCYFRGEYYDHGRGFSPRLCINCICQDGQMSCDRQDQSKCPPLDCPRHEQTSIPGECCRFCRNADYCALRNNCHVNATCKNIATRSACYCNEGFIGDGKSCEDRDECASEGGLHGNHCHSSTKCINTVGSYYCQCLPGFKRVDPNTCEDQDECETGEHTCDPHAKCFNTIGSYMCRCQHGYKGNGFTCSPVCNETCTNGGECVAPGTCQCRKGYIGRHCQLDLDECKLGVAQCHPNSECINIPGSYFCQCKTGYYSNHADNKQGALCDDINECRGWGRGHRCPVGTVCENTEGSYRCICLDEKTCRPGCDFQGRVHKNGSTWEPDSDGCTLCECLNGDVSCQHKACNCDDPDVSLTCCAECDPRGQCHHHELPITYRSGDTWLYKCQTCQCLDGEIDCWDLKCPQLSCSPTVHIDGDCCPKCADDNDPCQQAGHLAQGQSSKFCYFNGRTFTTGDSWKWDACVHCSCKSGHTCCSYNQTCTQLPSVGKTTEITTLAAEEGIPYPTGEELSSEDSDDDEDYTDEDDEESQSAEDTDQGNVLHIQEKTSRGNSRRRGQARHRPRPLSDRPDSVPLYRTSPTGKKETAMERNKKVTAKTVDLVEEGKTSVGDGGGG